MRDHSAEGGVNGRPANLLFLEHEHASILENVGQTLSDSYGVGHIKAELCVWLLRNEQLDVATGTISSAELTSLISEQLSTRYTAELVAAIVPSEEEIKKLLRKSMRKMRKARNNDEQRELRWQRLVSAQEILDEVIEALETEAHTA